MPASPFSAAQARQLEELLDREAIREVLFRYARGVDRADEAALRSAYWPDATDCHGAYRGSADGFIAQALERLRRGGLRSHVIGNILIELHGAQAVVESYFIALQAPVPAQVQDPVRATLLAGRYADRFEKRSGEWRVAERTVVYDWIEETSGPISHKARRCSARASRWGRSHPWMRSTPCASAWARCPSRLEHHTACRPPSTGSSTPLT
jgi:hypothetical protein